MLVSEFLAALEEGTIETDYEVVNTIEGTERIEGYRDATPDKVWGYAWTVLETKKFALQYVENFEHERGKPSTLEFSTEGEGTGFSFVDGDIELIGEDGDLVDLYDLQEEIRDVCVICDQDMTALFGDDQEEHVGDIKNDDVVILERDTDINLFLHGAEEVCQDTSSYNSASGYYSGEVGISHEAALYKLGDLYYAELVTKSLWANSSDIHEVEIFGVLKDARDFYKERLPEHMIETMFE